MPELRNKLRRIYVKWKKPQGSTTWEKIKVQRSSENRSPLAKSPRLPVMDIPRTSTTAQDVDANMVPENALPMGKNAKGKANLLSSAVARKTLVLTARDLAKSNKKPGPKKKFHGATADSESSEAEFPEYDTDEVTVQVDSVEAKAEETKSTKIHFAKKLPKLVTKVYLDEDQSSDVLYATVELELPNVSTKKLKGKVNTGAQVNLMNYMTFQEIFGDDAEKLLNNSQVKLTGYGGKRFKNHKKIPF